MLRASPDKLKNHGLIWFFIHRDWQQT